MEAIESLDKECSALGGLFQQVVNDMKVRIIFFLNCKKRSRRVFFRKEINVSKKGFLEKHFTFTFELYKRWFFAAGQFYVQLVF